MVNKTRITVLKRDISVVSLMRSYGHKVYYGDATKLELLRAMSAEKASTSWSRPTRPKTIWPLFTFASTLSPFADSSLRPGALKRMSYCKPSCRDFRTEPSLACCS